MRAENVALALHHLQRGVEFALVEQQPFVLDAGIGHHADAALHGVDRVADGVQDAFARTHAAGDAVRAPSRDRRCRRSARMRPAERPLRALAVSPTSSTNRLAIVPVLLDLIVRSAADRVAEIDEILQQQRHRIGLGLRQQRVDDFAGEAVIGGGAEHRPACVAGTAGAVSPPAVVLPVPPVEALPALFPPVVLPPSLPLTLAVVSLAPSEAVFAAASGSNSSAVKPVLMMRVPGFRERCR